MLMRSLKIPGLTSDRKDSITQVRCNPHGVRVFHYSIAIIYSISVYPRVSRALSAWIRVSSSGAEEGSATSRKRIRVRMGAALCCRPGDGATTTNGGAATGSNHNNNNTINENKRRKVKRYHLIHPFFYSRTWIHSFIFDLWSCRTIQMIALGVQDAGKTHAIKLLKGGWKFFEKYHPQLSFPTDSFWIGWQSEWRFLSLYFFRRKSMKNKETNSSSYQL